MGIQNLYNNLHSLLAKLEIILDSLVWSFKNEQSMLDELNHYNVSTSLIRKVLDNSRDSLTKLQGYKSEDIDSFVKDVRTFIALHYGTLYDLIRMLILQIVYYTRSSMRQFMITDDNTPLKTLLSNYMMLDVNHKLMVDAVKGYYFKDYKRAEELVVDDTSPLWDVGGMEHKIFPSDYSKVRQFTDLVLTDVPNDMRENPMILHEMVAELIKNAMRHGNNRDPNKIVKVWWQWGKDYFKFIVEDEGTGFQELEAWNEFNKERNKVFAAQDVEQMMEYVNYRGPNSTEEDGGNALISALEFWDSGLTYSSKRNKVVVLKYIR